jgi:AcrR family transcriptional regulator
MAAKAKKGGDGADQARGAELLWGPPERPSRGPKPGLSLDRIVQAAIKIADAEGLPAVSMQRVAAEFGFTTMSLYRYVPGKAELIDLMVEHGIGDAPELAGAPGDWRAKLTDWAQQIWQVFHRHPWLLGAAERPRVMGPREIGWMERAVQALAGTGLTGTERVEAALAVNGHVRSVSRFSAPDGSSDEEWVRILGELLGRHADRFPALNAAIADGAFGPDEDGGLEPGLRFVLDGIGVRIDERPASPKTVG